MPQGLTVEGHVLVGFGGVGEYAYAVAVQFLLSENQTIKLVLNVISPLSHVRQRP